MRILSIIGTRPEALKMGPVDALLARTAGIESKICVTGQHRELLKAPLELFRLKPDFNLGLMRRDQAPESLLAALLVRLGPIIRRVRPDWILAAGDTTSVLGASLAAAHHRVRFGHIEAGLRTPEKWDPFPEEFNRRVTTVLADLHFAPTTEARRNLRRENIAASQIVVTGNPIIDTLRRFATDESRAHLPACWKKLAPNSGQGQPPRVLVVTFHRRENLGEPMRNICAALRDLAMAYRGTLKILCIVHPNPAVSDPTHRDLAGVPHVVLSRPLPYQSMIESLRRAHLVLTDSGGLQEEAPWLRVPVLVLRKTTERPEGVAAGVAKLVGTDRVSIVRHVQDLLDQPRKHRTMARGFAGYGDGHAAARIIAALTKK